MELLTHASREEVQTITQTLRESEVALNQGRAYWHFGVATIEAVDVENPDLAVLESGAPFFRIAGTRFTSARASINKAITLAEKIEDNEDFLKSMNEARELLDALVRGSHSLQRQLAAKQIPSGNTCYELASAFKRLDERMAHNAHRRARSE